MANSIDSSARGAHAINRDRYMARRPSFIFCSSSRLSCIRMGPSGLPAPAPPIGHGRTAIHYWNSSPSMRKQQVPHIESRSHSQPLEPLSLAATFLADRVSGGSSTRSLPITRSTRQHIWGSNSEPLRHHPSVHPSLSPFIHLFIHWFVRACARGAYIHITRYFMYKVLDFGFWISRPSRRAPGPGLRRGSRRVGGGSGEVCIDSSIHNRSVSGECARAAGGKLGVEVGLSSVWLITSTP